jgi:sugar phosphate isomerase/epimerase
MRFGLLGLIMSDWSDVTYELVAMARELGFRGLGAHLTVPASRITDETAARVRKAVDDNGLEFFQVWGPYPSIVSRDEEVRQRGVEGAREVARLAARMGVPASGVRPTSHNPRGDWWPHPDNHTQETEDTVVRSLSEILDVAVPLGITIVLEKHHISPFDSAERVRRVIERTDPKHVKVNIDPANFVDGIHTAFNAKPMVDHLFDVLGEFCATTHVKDVDLEDRFVVHVAETIPGTGIMDLDTVLLRTAALPDGWAIVEHLPVSQIALAKKNLTERAKALGIDIR